MSRHSKRKAHKAQSSLWGGIAGIVGILLLAGMIGGYLYVQESRIPTNPITLCPESGPVAMTTVLIDGTDSLNAIQKNAIMLELRAIQQETIQHELVEIYNVTELHDTLIKPVFAMCNPGAGENMNKLYENPALAKRKWQTQFIQPLNTALTELTSSGGSDHSPIMESIQSIAGVSLGTVGAMTPKHFIIISDMLQNSEGLSFYKSDIPSEEEFKKSRFFSKIRTQYLKGSEVTLLLLRRHNASALQNKKAMQFWQSYFAEQGAVVIRVKFIDG